MSVATLTESRDYGRRLEYTLDRILPGIKNNVFVHSPIASMYLSQVFDQTFGGGFQMGRGHRSQMGGESIRVEHNLGVNTSRKRLTGPWDTIDTTPSDTVRHSRANWTDYSVTATFNKREQLENRGEYEIASMIENETKHSVLSLVDLAADDLYNNGALPNAITSLDQIISANDTIQGLSGATYTTWNSRGLSARGTVVGSVTFDGSAAGYSDSFAVAGLQVMRVAWNNASEGALVPTSITTTYDVFSFYEGQITPQERYTSPNLGNLSFLNLAFKSAPVMPDPKATAGTMWFHNTDVTYLVCLEGADFDRDEAVRALEQESWTIPIMLKCNLVCEDRRLVNKWVNITA